MCFKRVVNCEAIVRNVAERVKRNVVSSLDTGERMGKERGKKGKEEHDIYMEYLFNVQPQMCISF